MRRRGWRGDNKEVQIDDSEVHPALELLYQLVLNHSNCCPTTFMELGGQEICYTCEHPITTDNPDDDENHAADCKWIAAVDYCVDNHPEMIRLGKHHGD